MSEDKKAADTSDTPNEAEKAAPETPASGTKADTAPSEAEKSGAAEPVKAAQQAEPKPPEKKKAPVKPAAKSATKKTAAKSAAKSAGSAKSAEKKIEAKKPASSDTGSSKPQTPPSKEPHYTPGYAAGGAPSASASISEEKQGAGFPTLLAAAALGGLIVYFLVSGFGGSGLDEASKDQIDALQTQVDQMALSTDDPEVAKAIRTEINELKARVDRLARSGGSRRGSSDVAALEGGVTEINDAIRRLETRMSQLSGDVSRNEARLAARVETLETRTPTDLSSMLDTLTGRLASLERNDVARDAHRAATAVALANLARASQGNAPFGAEFEAVKIIMAGDESLGEVGVFAENGLPSIDALAKNFKSAARSIAKARRAESSWGFLGRLWNNLIASVTIRPKGDIKGTSVNAILARTEVRLEEGNLGAAIAEIEALEGKPAEAAQSWLEEARARRRLDELISALNTRVIAGISADTRRALSGPAAGRAGPGALPGSSHSAPAPAPVEEPAAPEEPAPEEGETDADGTLQDGEAEDAVPAPQLEQPQPAPQPETESDSI